MRIVSVFACIVGVAALAAVVSNGGATSKAAERQRAAATSGSPSRQPTGNDDSDEDANENSDRQASASLAADIKKGVRQLYKEGEKIYKGLFTEHHRIYPQEEAFGKEEGLDGGKYYVYYLPVMEFKGGKDGDPRCTWNFDRKIFRKSASNNKGGGLVRVTMLHVEDPDRWLRAKWVEIRADNRAKSDEDRMDGRIPLHPKPTGEDKRDIDQRFLDERERTGGIRVHPAGQERAWYFEQKEWKAKDLLAKYPQAAIRMIVLEPRPRK